MTSSKFIIQGETQLLVLFILGSHNKQETLLVGLPAEDCGNFLAAPYCLKTHMRFPKTKRPAASFPSCMKDLRTSVTTVP